MKLPILALVLAALAPSAVRAGPEQNVGPCPHACSGVSVSVIKDTGSGDRYVVYMNGNQFHGFARPNGSTEPTSYWGVTATPNGTWGGVCDCDGLNMVC